MRIETKDLAASKRKNLWEVVPLSTPFSMYIDVTNRCNFACKYCPTGNPDMIQAAKRELRYMTLDLFLKIIADMGEFAEPVKVVNLYKDGEPLVNPNFPLMVRLLREAGVCEKIYAKTNGQLIAKYPDLATLPLDMLGLSVSHVTSGGFEKISGRRVDYDEYKDGVRRLFDDSRRKFTINAKIARYQMTDADIEKFYRDFGPICDTVAVEGLHGWGANSIKDMLLEDIGTHDGTPFNYKLACPLPFYMLSVSSDGTVNVCCAEWGNFHRLGDANTQSLFDIWNGGNYKAFRLMHLEGRRFENIACNDCQYRDTLPDNIDEHRQQMLERMK